MKILIPTDYSLNAQQATNYGIKLAQMLSADVLLVHAYHMPVVDPNFVPNIGADSEKEEQKMLDKVTQFNAVFKNVSIDSRVIYGPIVDVLDKLCEEENIDLVVMGTKGQTNAIDGLIGTIASNVLKNVGCDVLVVPAEAEFGELDEIVLATDYHQLDDYSCFNTIKKILDRTDANLALVNVQNELNLFQIPSRTENRLQEFFNNYKLSKHFVQSDDIEAALEHFAKSHAADLIVLTAPHYSFWQKIWHRSLSKKMALHSELPVLVLKE